MSNRERERSRPGHRLLWVEDAVHAAVTAWQERLGGRREGATQSEVVRKGLEALEREQEAGK